MNKKYNGYTNYETWNVALWIANHEPLYKLMQCCKDYGEFVDILHKRGVFHTGDGIVWSDPKVNIEEINELEFNDR